MKYTTTMEDVRNLGTGRVTTYRLESSVRRSFLRLENSRRTSAQNNESTGAIGHPADKSGSGGKGLASRCRKSAARATPTIWMDVVSPLYDVNQLASCLRMGISSEKLNRLIGYRLGSGSGHEVAFLISSSSSGNQRPSKPSS
jgi:hypothetical protein